MKAFHILCIDSNNPLPLDPSRRYFFVAIGGIGMSAIAQILLARGFRVAGSDIRPSAMLERLRALGAETFVGHDAAHLQPGDMLVLSDAIKPDNPEWRAGYRPVVAYRQARRPAGDVDE